MFQLKKWIIFILTICLTIVLTACVSSKESSSKQASSKEMTTYQVGGKSYKVPKHPQRVAVLQAFYVGNFIKLGIEPVAVADFTADSSIIKPHIKDVPLIGEDDVEKVADAKPDLIVVDAMDKNIKKYEKIAPTVPYEYNDYTHKEIMKEIGKLTNKEDQANDWLKDWDSKTKQDQKEIKQAVGTKATASIFEVEEKGLTIFASNWGRGTDIVNDAFGMEQPAAYKEKLNEKNEGYAPISTEIINRYAGDYIFLSKPSYGNTEFEKSNLWNELPAVKQDKVIEYKAEDYWFTDPLTLEKLREYLKQQILEKAK